MSVPPKMSLARTAALCALALTAATVAGCSSGEAAESDREPPAESTDVQRDADSDRGGEPERVSPQAYSGSDEDFYRVPDPLPAGSPGDLIRYQDLGEAEVGTEHPVRSYRVMYLSADATGADRAVTGIITVPGADAPSEGWPVVSYGHGTAGMAPRCAPSRDGRAAPGWGVEGVWAVTDYVGLGPVGEIHPYLSRPSEGNAVIDIVTAAGQLPDSGAGHRWVAVGHSQGGHAVLAAHELAAQRAPALELVATAAVAPGVGIDTSYGIDGDLMTVLTMMQLYGAVTEHADLDVEDYFTDEATTAAEVFGRDCVDEIIAEMEPVVAAEPFELDPWTNEPAESVLRSNQVGTTAVPEVPVLLASGTADLTVVPERVSAFYDRLCEVGQPTVFREVPGADHASIIALIHTQVGEFLNRALEDRAPEDGAPEDRATAGGPSAPVPDDCP